MLLATYALLTLSIEQKRERASIQNLQDFLACPCSSDDFDGAQLATRAEELIHFAESHHQRRLKDGLFPALRAKSLEAGEALRKHEHLCRVGREILPGLRWYLRPGAYFGQHQIEGAYGLVQAYCRNLLERLACEEDVLLPLAERVLPSEVWFAVGTEFLAQDAQRA
jgi:hypothetical protein